MSIAIAGSGANHYATGTTATSLTVTFGVSQNMPTPTNGNLLFAVVLVCTSTTGGTGNVNYAPIPSGWHYFGSSVISGGGNLDRSAVYWKIANGTETSVTFSNTNSSWTPTGMSIAIVEFSGVDTKSPIAVPISRGNYSTAAGTAASFGRSLTAPNNGTREVHAVVFDGHAGGTVTEDASSSRIDFIDGVDYTRGGIALGWSSADLTAGSSVSSSETLPVSNAWSYISCILNSSTSVTNGNIYLAGGNYLSNNSGNASSLTVSFTSSPSSSGTVAGSFPYTMAVPTSGNLLLAYFVSRSLTVQGITSCSTPTGWTKRTEYAFSSTNSTWQCDIFYRVADGTESSVTFTCPLTGTVSVGISIAEFAGVDTTSPFDVDGSATLSNPTAQTATYTLSSPLTAHRTGNREVHFCSDTNSTVVTSEDSGSGNLDFIVGVSGQNPLIDFGWGRNGLTSGNTVQSSVTGNAAYWGYYSAVLNSILPPVPTIPSFDDTPVLYKRYNSEAFMAIKPLLPRSLAQSFVVASTSSPKIVKVVGKRLIAVSPSITKMVKRISKVVSVVSASSVKLVKQIRKTFSISSANASKVVKRIGKSFSVSSSSSPKLVKIIGKRLIATSASSAKFVRSVRKVISKTSPVVKTLLAGRVSRITLSTFSSIGIRQVNTARILHKTLTGSLVSTASMIRRRGKLLSTTTASSPLVNRARKLLKSLSVTRASAAAVSTIRNLKRTISKASTSVATLPHGFLKPRSLIASTTSVTSFVKRMSLVRKVTSVSVPKFVRAITKAMTRVTSASSAKVVKQVRRIITATKGNSVTMLPGKVFKCTLLYVSSSASSVTLLRTFKRTLSKASASSVSIVKRVTRRLIGTGTSHPSVVALKGIFKTIAATSITSASVGRIKKYVKVMVGVSVSNAYVLRRQIRVRVISFLQYSSVAMIRVIARKRTITATSVSVAKFARRIAKTLVKSSPSSAVLVNSGRRVLKTLSSVSISIPVVGRHLIRAIVLLASPITATSIKRIRKKLVTVAAISITASTFRKAISKTILKVSPSVVSIVRRTGKTLKGSSSSFVSMTRQLARVIRLTYVAHTGPNALKRITKSVKGTSVSLAVLSILKVRRVVLSAVSVVSKTLNSSRLLKRTLSATSNTIRTMTEFRKVLRPLSASSASVSSLVRRVSKRLLATPTSAAVIAAGRHYTKSVLAVSVSVPKFVRRIAKAVPAASVSAPKAIRRIGKILIKTTVTAAMINRGNHVSMTLIAVAHSVPRFVRFISKAVKAVPVTAPVVRKAISKAVRASTVSVPRFAKAIKKTILRVTPSNVSLAPSKRLLRAFMGTSHTVGSISRIYRYTWTFLANSVSKAALLKRQPKRLTAASASVVTLIHKMTKVVNLASTAHAVLSIVRKLSYRRSLSSTTISAATVSKGMRYLRTLALTSTSVSKLVRFTSKNLKYVVATSPVINRSIRRLKSLAGIAVSAASISRKTSKKLALQAVSLSQAVINRRMLKVIRTNTTSIATVITNFIVSLFGIQLKLQTPVYNVLVIPVDLEPTLVLNTSLNNTLIINVNLQG